MLRAWKNPGVIRAAQIVVGILFGWAALAKLADLSAFALQVHNFRLLPISAENLVAMLLPWVELVAALALVLRIQPRAGAWVAGVLLAVFTLGVASAMARGLDFECGWAGGSSPRTWACSCWPGSGPGSRRARRGARPLPSGRWSPR
jgi:uncharacterized membrane protein YphA (DoxX/SURF4 family)